MSLDEQLTQLLAQLGVRIEGRDDDEEKRAGAPAEDDEDQVAQYDTPSTSNPRTDAARDAEAQVAGEGPPEVSLFQTSREHYGVFYRLDLIGALPQLRIFLPDDEGVLKMRCYLVRAALGTPLHDWFLSARTHDGSAAFDDAREVAQQHLLFAVGELMKRLFWHGDIEELRFAEEIEVVRLA
jgi:hypothetical protein